MTLKQILTALPVIERQHLPGGAAPNTLRIVVGILACVVATWAIVQGCVIVAASGVAWDWRGDPFVNIIRPGHPNPPTTEDLTPLGLAIARLANLGILILGMNALFEIALLVNEPGIAHVRRVLALSFTGMAIYLIKEYPLTKETIEFLLGCLSGGIAGAMWMIYPIGKSDAQQSQG